MRVLITGIAGHLGSALAKWILEIIPDCEVYGIDDLSCGYRENVPKGVTYHPLHLGFGNNLEFCFSLWKPDYVFHFAAYAAEGLSPFIRTYNYQNNLLATAQIVNACINHNVKRLVFTSSMAVYGKGDPEGEGHYGNACPFVEYDPCTPIDPYGIAKLACEQDIRVAGEQHGLDWCILRPHNCYGPGQSIWQKYRNVFGIWMSRVLQGLSPQIYGDGQQRRAFSYIDDIVPCLWQAAVAPEASKQIINLGGATPISVFEACHEMHSVMPGAWLPQDSTQARHEVKDAWCTVEKSQRLLGYEDRTPLHEGLFKMWTWAQEAWEEYPERRGTHEVAPIEVEKGLYPFWKEQCTDATVR